MEPMTPIYTADLFLPLNAELVSLLRGLDGADWARQTIAPAWRVRDVAAHLLDGALRRLAFARDNHSLRSAPPSSYEEVLALINGLNASGVRYADRLSPRLVIDLLDITGRWVSDLFQGLPPHGDAHFAVAWAGEDRSENWMDIGREYTEQWHHQMQIRDAVGAPGLLQRRWLHPLLDLSVRALPRAYKDVAAPPGTRVVFEVTGEDDYAWIVARESSIWRVGRGRADRPAATISADADVAWRLLFNGLAPADARRRIAVSGDRSLAEPMLGARSVMV
jgi:uncharacterized protein (TIGR03083 family)